MSETETTPTDDALRESAQRLGREAGKAAASWVFDGNTTQATYRKFLRGIDDGDPEVLDSVRAPSFSGEFAGDYSETDLWDDLGIEPEPEDSEFCTELADAYVEAAGSAMWYEIARLARVALGL